MTVAEVCGEKMQSIIQHQVKRLPSFAKNFTFSLSGYLQSNSQILTWKKPGDVKKELKTGTSKAPTAKLTS